MVKVWACPYRIHVSSFSRIYRLTLITARSVQEFKCVKYGTQFLHSWWPWQAYVKFSMSLHQCFCWTLQPVGLLSTRFNQRPWLASLSVKYPYLSQCHPSTLLRSSSKQMQKHRHSIKNTGWSRCHCNVFIMPCPQANSVLGFIYGILYIHARAWMKA